MNIYLAQASGRELSLGPGALVVLAGYLVVMLGLGFLGRASRKEETLKDFYLAGSTFGFVVLFLTLFATQYSGNTLLGFAGRSYQQGATYVVSVTFMSFIITVFMIYAPRLYRLGKRFGYITPSDYVFHRFGSHWLRILTVVLMCWGLANYILENLVAMGHGVEAISNGRMSFMQGVLLLVGVMLIYESLGGNCGASAWTDVVQGLLLLGGCSVILYILVTAEGGLAAAAKTIGESAPEKLEPPDAQGIRSWISTLLMLGIGAGLYPHAIQRMFAARDELSLRRSLGLMAFMPLVTTLLAFLIGFIGLSRFPGLSQLESDKITIYVLGTIVDQSPIAYWLVVFVFCAVVAAIMSTADSALLSIGSMFTKDIYKNYLNRDASQKQMLRVGKAFSWAVMALLIAMAWVSLETESSIWLLIKLKLEFLVQLAPIFLLSVHWRRMTATSALVGILAGTLVTLVIWCGVVADLWTTRSPWGIGAGIWGLTLNFAICLVISALSRPRSTVSGKS